MARSRDCQPSHLNGSLLDLGLSAPNSTQYTVRRTAEIPFYSRPTMSALELLRLNPFPFPTKLTVRLTEAYSVLSYRWLDARLGLLRDGPVQDLLSKSY